MKLYIVINDYLCADYTLERAFLTEEAAYKYVDELNFSKGEKEKSYTITEVELHPHAISDLQEDCYYKTSDNNFWIEFIAGKGLYNWTVPLEETYIMKLPKDYDFSRKYKVRIEEIKEFAP